MVGSCGLRSPTLQKIIAHRRPDKSRPDAYRDKIDIARSLMRSLSFAALRTLVLDYPCVQFDPAGNLEFSGLVAVNGGEKPKFELTVPKSLLS